MTDKPKKSHKKDTKKPWNHFRAQERAEYFFLIYEALGVKRTLKRLWGLLRSVGATVSLKTLEEYSAKYGWQARILERAARHESADFQDVQDAVDRMNDEHARLFQNIGALANAGVSKYLAEIQEKAAAGMKPTLDVDMQTIAKLAQAYQYGERLARGQATSKAEIIVEVLPPLVKDLFAVFLAVNVITNDPPELVRRRQSEFVQRGDQVLQTYYGQPTKELAEGRG